MLRVGSWSGDGEWLFYWTFTEEEATASYTMPPGTLHFLNARTGQACKYAGAAAYGYGRESVLWQSNGTVIVFDGAEARSGPPCGEFAAAEDRPGTQGDPDSALSPAGTYRARTEVRINDVGTLSAVTTILDTATGQIVNRIEWTHRGGEGDLGLGGQWLTDDVFLIHETWDRGPLLVRVGEEPVAVASEQFGLPSVPNLRDGSFGLRASAVTAPDTGVYHLILFGLGEEAGFPPVRLYHSESGAVEDLSFEHLWARGFTEDGQWVLLDSRPIVDGYERNELWFRALDPPGSRAQLLATGVTSAVWSPDMAKVAVSAPDRVRVYAFPSATELGVWGTGEYAGVPMAWAPDGARLAAHGYVPGQVREALFVIDVR
jgi:hypothetical protein